MEVFIASSSSNTIDPKYLQLARTTSKFFTSRNFDLVFGGANFSMMGECYHAFAEEGKQIEAFTVEKYADDLKGLPKANCHLVSDTLVRFKWMFDISEVIVILPGGIGSLAEFTCCLEENRTFHNKKLVILYNFEGFYDKIIDWMKEATSSGFLSESLFNDFKIIKNNEELKIIVDEYLEELENENG